MLRRPGIRHVRAAPNPGGYSPIWPPTKLPGYVAWYDMLETYTESGGTVTAIRNMVSGSDDMAEATNPPAFESGGFNGLPCAKGDGINDRLLSTEAAVAAVVSGVSAWTSTVVLQPATNATAFGFGSTANNIPRGAFLTFTTQGTTRSRPAATRVADSGTPNGTAESEYIVNRTVDFCVITTLCLGTHSLFVVNLGRPSAPSPYAAAPMTIDRVSLFCRGRQSPDSFSAARIAAALLRGRASALSEVYGLHSALMHRWNIPA